jgi:RHS repeat-associated protein
MSNPQQPWLIRYRYDPLDRLTSHTQSDNPERHRFYCKNRLATEIQGAIGHSIVQHDDGLLAQQQRHTDGHETTLLVTDLQRSVLYTLTRDRQPQPIAYSPYGHRPAENGLTSLLGFNGERPDAVTGHYLLGNGYRAFNPVMMRFNSPDSFSPFGRGGLNSYTYCSGSPISRIDPTGHFHLPTFIVSKTLKWLNTARKHIAINEALTGITTTGLFGKIKQIPDILENIIQRLPGKDMVSLAQTSSRMKNIVYSSAKPLPIEFAGMKTIKLANSGTSLHGKAVKVEFFTEGNTDRIGSGLVPGILPVQLPRSGIDVTVNNNRIPYFAPHLATDPRFSDPTKTWTLRSLT